jgi:hypothetical protein
MSDVRWKREDGRWKRADVLNIDLEITFSVFCIVI